VQIPCPESPFSPSSPVEDRLFVLLTCRRHRVHTLLCPRPGGSNFLKQFERRWPEDSLAAMSFLFPVLPCAILHFHSNPKSFGASLYFSRWILIAVFLPCPRFSPGCLSGRSARDTTQFCIPPSGALEKRVDQHACTPRLRGPREYAASRHFWRRDLAPLASPSTPQSCLAEMARPALRPRVLFRCMPWSTRSPH